MTTIDMWGKIELDKNFELIVNSKEFKDIKDKTQLGLNSNPNATHTRYQHSFGVYALVCKLIDICKKKFSDRIVITEEEEKAFKVMALIHDIGHGCFSHVSERYLEGTHEERTVDLLEDSSSEIHNILIKSPFGPRVLEKVIELIQMKKKICSKEEVADVNNLMLIIGKLLSGGIDVDRIDYIRRDSINVLGQDADFSDILEAIDLEFIDDSLEVVFDEEAEYSIANFFNKRFELYDTVYCSAPTRILERIFDILLKLTGFRLDWNTTEIEMKNFFRECSKSRNPLTRRYAELLSARSIDSGVIFKEVDNESTFDFTVRKIKNAIPDLANYEDCFFLDSVLMDIYNKKNKVFIRKGGLIQELSDCSKILNANLRKEKHIFAVDVVTLEYSLKRDGKTEKEISSIIKKLRKLLSPEIEQEKKYIFNDNSKNPLEEFKQVQSALDLHDGSYKENDDQYYDHLGILNSEHINLRQRSSEDMEWTLKRPVKDSSSISKRDEKDFSSKEEALEFLRCEWGIKLDDVEKELRLKTKRVKYLFECFGGVFELVFDKTVTYCDGTEYPAFYMIECELKSGNSSGLYFINKKLKAFEFLSEVNISKREIAEGVVSKMTPVGGRLKFTSNQSNKH